MDLEIVCSQYPIAKIITNYLTSMKDFNSLIGTSPQMKNFLVNCPVRKTFNTVDKTLIFERDNLKTNIEVDRNNIFISYNELNYTLDKLEEIFNEYDEEKFEHIKCITIQLYGSYFNYNENNRFLFGKHCAQFIDKLFERASNATTLEIINVHEIQSYIIKHLKSHKIQVLKKINVNELVQFGIKYSDSCCEIFENLKNLKKMELFVRNLDFYDIKLYKDMLIKIFQQLSTKSDNIINLYGEIRPKNFQNLKRLLKQAEDYNINISLNESFLCSKDFFDVVYKENLTYPVNNITSLTISIWDESIYQKSFRTLPFFTKLIKLKLHFRDQLFENIINKNLINFFSNNIDYAVFQKIEQIEEFHLIIQNCSIIYDINEYFNKSFELKDQLTNNICLLLGHKLKNLYLKGVPNLGNEISYHLSNKCPNLENIHLTVLNTISPKFIENMKKLKFISLQGLHKLNIPSNVNMFIIYPYNDNLNKEIFYLSNDKVHNFLNKSYGKNFKHFFRSHCKDFIKYIVLFDNILHWTTYLEHLDNY
uniref:F-box domain-containing protein n=1 Tax=Strongyloides stercoralis TaxID=6248 RepID=A0A0K0ERP9_STRER